MTEANLNESSRNKEIYIYAKQLIVDTGKFATYAIHLNSFSVKQTSKKKFT